VSRKSVLSTLVLLGWVSFCTATDFQLREGNLDFSVDAIATYSIDRSGEQVKMYWEVPHKELLFTRVGGEYNARFEITVIAYDENGNQAGGDSWRKSYSVPSYEITLLETETFKDSLSFSLPPGRYRTKVAIRDLHSASRGVVTLDISVPEIRTENVSLSELLFVKNGVPVLERNFAPDDSVAVRHVIYNLSLLAGYRLEARIAGMDTERNVGDPHSLEPDSLLRLEWELDLSQLWNGEYEFSISVISRDGEVADQKSRSFRVRRSPFVDEALFREMVDQLQYVATAEEIRWLREMTPEQREKGWNSFWKQRDPTPATEANEFKEEYYSRIKYANTHFGALQKGWMTDRGRIYVIYGPPDEVERHPYELDSVPYEIWYYYRTAMKFIFVDEHGIGDYRLFSPRGERW
jgi:GWxTD domain-containing protein